MTNEQYIISHISEIDLADMFNTGNVYHTDLLIRIQTAFEEWKRNYQHKRFDSLLFQLWLTFQYNEKEWERYKIIYDFKRQKNNVYLFRHKNGREGR